ncbi:MAG: hypothetical protein WEB62_11420 [Bacteroidota bacterium]
MLDFPVPNIIGMVYSICVWGSFYRVIMMNCYRDAGKSQQKESDNYLTSDIFEHSEHSTV